MDTYKKTTHNNLHTTLLIMNKNKNTENILLLALVVFGLAGAYFMLGGKDSTTDAAALPPIAVSADYSSYAAPTSTLRDKNPKQHLSIAGNMHTGNSLQFAIESFNENAEYILELGNGTTKVLKEKDFYFTYDTPGNYKVKLSVKYNDKTRVLFAESIFIDSKERYATAY
jgi:hypothetical protein